MEKVSAGEMMDILLGKLATGRYTLCVGCGVEWEPLDEDGYCDRCDHGWTRV